MHPTIESQATAYLYHLIKNHAFLDGNKRTALGVTEAFLRSNNYNLDLSTDDLFELIQQIANNHLSKEEITVIIESYSYRDTTPLLSLDLLQIEELLNSRNLKL